MTVTAPVTDRAAALDAVATELAGFFNDPSKFPDRYDMFRRLREIEPVHWSKYESWVITGFPEAEEALLHPAIGRRASAERQMADLHRPGVDPPDIVEAVEIWLAGLINHDDPAHNRLRRLVSRAFSPRAVASWKPRIEAIVNDLISGVEDRDEFDFLHDVAYGLPTTVICELMGVPLQDVRGLTSSLNHARIMNLRGTDDVAGPEEELRVRTQVQLAAQVEYYRTVIEDRRKHPREGDLITDLVQAEEAGDRLSLNELIGTVMLIVGAGHETTANLLGNGMLALLEHREQFEMLQRDRSLLPSALDEILRHASPSPGQPRTATEDMTIGGRDIKAGQHVSVILNACNRDPRVCNDPDRFDITRTNVRNITFTAGIHYCLGAALARTEAGIMLEAVANRLSDIELAIDPSEVQWRPTFIRGLAALPVRRVRAG